MSIGRNINQYVEKIEDYFKVLKNSLEMRKIQKFTPKSVEKTLFLYVLLGTLLIQQCDMSKTALQKLSQNVKISDP